MPQSIDEPQGNPEDSPRPMSRTARRALFAALLVVAIFVAVVCRSWWVQAAGEAKLARLLSGDAAVRLVRVETDLQGRRLLCDDPEVLGPLADAMRAASYKGQNAGTGLYYHVTLAFEGGERMTTVMYARSDGISISLPALAVEHGFPTHDVQLSDPLPSKLKTFIDFLDGNAMQGEILEMEAGKPPRQTHDPSLTAGW
ncbi:MAG: hypothetical protein NTW19_20865 [Planctomycetota bacterium]|nr:hypothetical protein [Planctomycetota bacterium]